MLRQPHSECAQAALPVNQPEVPVRRHSSDDDSEPVAIRHRVCRRTRKFVKVRPDDPHPLLPFRN